MSREGPCFHCGIDHAPLWTIGPPEKPVLCHTCGSRWKTKGTFEEHIPEQMEDVHSSQSNMFPKLNPISSAKIHGIEERNFFGQNLARFDQYPLVFGAGTNCGSGSGITMSTSSTQIPSAEATQAPLWDPNNSSRMKSSTLEERVPPPTERLKQKLYIALDVESAEEEDPESLLIFERINKYIPENEIGLGCMLLKAPPPSPTKDFNPDANKPGTSVGVKVSDVALGAKDSKPPIESIFVVEESPEDDISASKSEPLGVSIQSTGEPRRNNSPGHHMITRSKAKNREAHRLHGGLGSSGEDEVQHLNRRSQGHSRKSQDEFTFTSNSEHGNHGMDDGKAFEASDGKP